MAEKYHLDPGIVKTITTALPDVQAIYRYGSAGSKNERPESDIDIAVLAKNTVSLQKIMTLSAELMKLSGREIDLHDMRKLPVTLRVQIVLTGTRIYCADRVAAETYDTYTLSDYVRLNEERRYILDDIKQRAQIYE